MDNDVFTLLLSLFIGTLALQLYFTLAVFRKLAFYRPDTIGQDEEVPVSVIIASRNGGEHLRKTLPSVLNQDYPCYEVIVVNNNSKDDSSQILSEFEEKYPSLRVIELDNGKHARPGKKLPLTLGIKGAKYEHLLFTDVDCTPNSDQWIKQMASSFISNKEIVLGYGPFTEKKGMLNAIIRFDCVWIAMNYLSQALNRNAYMGVGRNLAYTKSTFYAVEGYKSHYSLISGDDDLFVQEASKKDNVAIQVDPKTYCVSDGKNSWSDWIRQKSRHYTTTPKYGFIKKLLLAIYPISLLLTWICFVSLVLMGQYTGLCILCMGLLCVIKWWIQGKCLLKLQNKRFAAFFPFWDLFYSLLIPVVYLLAVNKRNTKW